LQLKGHESELLYFFYNQDGRKSLEIHRISFELAEWHSFLQKATPILRGNLEENSPNASLPLTCLLFPSEEKTSISERQLPPNEKAGMFPLYSQLFQGNQVEILKKKTKKVRCIIQGATINLIRF